MKKTLLGLGIITALFPALANAGNGYIGGSFGQATYNDVFSSELEEAASNVGVELDDSDTGFKFFGGYRASEYVALEVFYTNLGEISMSSSTEEIAIESDSLGASFVGLIPLSKNFELFGKLGFHAWDSTIELSNDVSINAADGSDIMYGAGAAYRFDKLSIRAEYERYMLDDQDVDLMSVGFAYHF